MWRGEIDGEDGELDFVCKLSSYSYFHPLKKKKKGGGGKGIRTSFRHSLFIPSIIPFFSLIEEFLSLSRY